MDARPSDVSPERQAPRVGRLATFAVLLALPLFLRLWPIEHGLPETYVPDTHVVKNALGMARDKNPVPPSGRYSTYPYLTSYLLLPVYASQYALGRVTGAWSGSGEFGQAILTNPALVHLPARILIAILCALTPFVVFRAARAAGLGAGSWVAAWMVATGLLHVHFSVQERPWGPLVFWLALTTWPLARYAKAPNRRDLVLAGTCAGLAAATHQAGLLALGMCGLAWLVAGRGWTGDELKARLVDGVLCVGLAAVVALLLGYPFLFVHGAPESPTFEGAPEVHLAIGGQAIRFEVRWESLARLSRAFVGYDPALVVLALLGIVAAIARRGTRAATLFALAWLGFFMTNQNDHVRYLLPGAVLLAFPAGEAARLLLTRRWGIGVVAVLCLVPLVQALRMGWVLRQTDSRELARAEVLALPPDQRVAIDRYGPRVPYDRAALERLASWRDLGSREANRAMWLEAADEAGIEIPGGPGRDVVRIEDLYSFSDRYRTFWLAPGPAADPELAAVGEVDAHAALRTLGVTHLLLVDRRPGDGLPPLLIDAEPSLDGSEKPRTVHVADEPIFVVDPGRGDPPSEALLPTDMDFPLTALWQVERPGPYLELRALR